MPQSPDTTTAFRDPGEVLVQLIREGFTTGTVAAPTTIDLRANVPDLRVEGGDRVTVYRGGQQMRERIGNRHYKVTYPAKVDIRSVSRDRAYELLDAIVAQLDRLAIAPDPDRDWHELIVGDDQEVASYSGNSGRGGFTHIVLDVSLVNHLRTRRKPRFLEAA